MAGLNVVFHRNYHHDLDNTRKCTVIGNALGYIVVSKILRPFKFDDGFKINKDTVRLEQDVF